MATYAELKAQAQELMQKAEELRQEEVKVVVEDIRQKMRTFNITIEDLGGISRAGRAKPGQGTKEIKPAKYKGPNGELWSGGLGRKPDWVKKVLADGRNIEEFAI